jgi:hypothetical protein
MRPRHRDTWRAVLAALLLGSAAALAALPGAPLIRTSIVMQLPDLGPAADEAAEELLEESSWSPENRAPVADAGPDRAVRHVDEVRLSGSASFDPDGDAMTYQWTQVSGPAVVLQPNASAANPTFVAPWVGGRIVFRLRVADREGSASEDTVVVTVEAPATGDDVDQAEAGEGGNASRTAIALLAPNAP